MENKFLSADEIYNMTVRTLLVPLQCQERYARQLASLLSMHLKRSALMEYGFPAESLPSCSAIIVSGTGQGKSFILRQMAKTIGVNLIVVDASTLAKETWKGATLGERLLAEKEAAKDMSVFRKSLLFIDEIDKIRMHKSGGNAGNPMDNLLQLFESGVVTAEGKQNNAVNIDISQFTIICAGAFDGLEMIVEQRIKPKASIGFTQTQEEIPFSKAELLRMVKMEDLEQYGMMPELLGRIGTILSIDTMGIEDYRQLLSLNQGSVCWRYANYLRAFFGIDLKITDDAVQVIAEECTKKGSGARAANTVTQRWMQEAISTAERDDMICKIVLDADGENCFLRYEFGSRTYTLFREKSENATVHVVKAKCITHLTEQLCQIYKKNGGDPLIFPELKAFLNCSLHYLRNHSDEGSFTFLSLEKLIQTMQKKDGARTSMFDTLMLTERAAYDDIDYDGQLKAYYQDFLEYDSPWLAYRLGMALNQIMDYIVREYGSELVKFKIEELMEA